MHIHYNTNQTTLPLEFSSILPPNHVVFTIEKVVNALEDSHLRTFYHDFGRPSYHPKMLLSALLFAYSQGVFSGRKIEKLMVENPRHAVFDRAIGGVLPHHQSLPCRCWYGGGDA